VTYFENEKALTRWVLKEARKRDWVAAHLSTHQVVRKRMADGSFQPVAVPDRNADGFPDLVLVHAKHGLVFAELKMPGRKPDAAQIVWLYALRETGTRVYVWSTSDQDAIIATLDGFPIATLLDEIVA
jgi:hypothetical protein